MRARLHLLQLKIQRRPVMAIGVVVAGVLGIALLVAIFLGYWFNWDWTGLGPYSSPAKGSNFHQGKTLWDWMQLLIIPLVLAIGGFALSQVQKNTEQKITVDNQRETALQAYIDKLSELLIANKLHELAEAEQARKVVRVRTLT